MNPQSLMFVDPPVLSDEAASEMLDFLYELINAFENHYGNQVPRFSQIPLTTSTTKLPPF